VLVELSVLEQRYQAVLEVLSGATVTEVARRYGVVRQTVHDWLRRYAAEGLGGVGGSKLAAIVLPASDGAGGGGPHRGDAPGAAGWGPRTILFWLEREGVQPLPGRTSVERCLVRHGLVTPQARRRKRSDYKRWERSRAMELWQLDVVGGVRLADGSEAKIVSGIDDHSRFVVCARVVARATARPVCDALVHAMRTHGVLRGDSHRWKPTIRGPQTSGSCSGSERR
jgi:Homeodomain-like domain